MNCRDSGLGIRDSENSGGTTMTDRREFVQTLGAAAAAYLLHPRAPNPYSRTPLHKIDRIGLQLYTVRDEMKKDVEGTLAGVAEAGYGEVEFAGYFGKSPAEIRAMLDHHGLTARSEEHTSELHSHSFISY